MALAFDATPQACDAVANVTVVSGLTDDGRR